MDFETDFQVNLKDNFEVKELDSFSSNSCRDIFRDTSDDYTYGDFSNWS